MTATSLQVKILLHILRRRLPSDDEFANRNTQIVRLERFTLLFVGVGLACIALVLVGTHWWGWDW